MDEVSVTRSPDPALASIVADANLCAQVAGALGVGEGAAERAFLGEPVEVVLAMAEWALSHEWDEGFDAEEALPAWAERRGRGVWREGASREEPSRSVHAGRNGERVDGGPFDGEPSNGEPSNRELAVEIARYWQECPEELVAALDRTARGVLGQGDGKAVG